MSYRTEFDPRREPPRWMAHPHKADVRREVLEAMAFLLTLVFVVAAMSVDFPA